MCVTLHALAVSIFVSVCATIKAKLLTGEGPWSTKARGPRRNRPGTGDDFQFLVGDLIPGGSWVTSIRLIVHGAKRFCKAAKMVKDKVKSNNIMDFVRFGSADDVLDTISDMVDVLSEDSAEELPW